MSSIDELIIIYIILNYQINKRVTCVVLCYSITNWIAFEFVISNPFIIHVVFELPNTIENRLLTRPTNILITMSPLEFNNWDVFEFVISDTFITRVMFGLVNTIENLLLTRPKHDPQIFV